MNIHNWSGAFFVFTLIASLGLFSSCSKSVASKPRPTSTKHFDIPIPLTFSPTQHASDTFMKLSGKLSVAQTIAFYKRELETTGWDSVDLSTKQEGFFYGNKPSKQCGIHIQTLEKPLKGNTTLITVFIKPGA